jgi:hypothetical protein
MRCAEQIFDANCDREQCSRKGTRYYDGDWWCWQHYPDEDAAAHPELTEPAKEQQHGTE